VWQAGRGRVGVVSATRGKGLRKHPDLELRKAGDWSDYNKTPVIKIRRGRTLYGTSLDFGHVSAVRESFPAFQAATAAAGRPDLSFQEGVPGDFDLAMFTLGPAGALRHGDRPKPWEANCSSARGAALRRELGCLGCDG